MKIEPIKYKDIKVGDEICTVDNYQRNTGGFFRVEQADLEILNKESVWVRKVFEPIPSYILTEDRNKPHGISTREVFITPLRYIIYVCLWITYWWIAMVLWYLKDCTDETFRNPTITYIPVIMLLWIMIGQLFKFIDHTKRKLS